MGSQPDADRADASPIVLPGAGREETKAVEESGWPQLDTGLLGGVDTVTRTDLRAMQRAPYMLHARGGELSQVPVEKSRLPRDPEGHNQALSLSLASDGTVYVCQPTTVSKSTDGGRTWTAHPISQGGRARVLSDGIFIEVSMDVGIGTAGPAEVSVSSDEGRTWEKLAEIEIDLPVAHSALYIDRGPERLPDDTLLWTVEARGVQYAGGDRGEYEARYVSGGEYLFSYRSTDSGRTWGDPEPMQAWGSEGGTAQLPSGRLLAAVRFQPVVNVDPPLPKKMIWLTESGDGGQTWENARQLTTVFGQCYGFPTALSDGTVVVIHDSRYGPGGARIPDIPLHEKIPSPGVPSGRAMISRDEGQTWEDEVYYTHFGDSASGYNESVVLEDGTVLSVVGTTDYREAATQWDSATGRSDLTAIRWRPVSA